MEQRAPSAQIFNPVPEFRPGGTPNPDALALMRKDSRIVTAGSGRSRATPSTRPGTGNLARFQGRSSRHKAKHWQRPKKHLSIREIHAKCQVKKERVPVDLAKHLVEEIEIPVTNSTTQCDEFHPREPPKPYLPPKVGKDIYVQVEVSDLFDFDREMEPILDAILNKIVDRASTEVRHEETLKAIRAYHEDLQRQEAEERERVRKLERAEEDRYRARVAKLLEENERKKAEANARRKINAKAFSKEYLAGLEDCVMANLREMRIFPDPAEEVLSAVVKKAEDQLEWERISKQMVDSMIAFATRRLSEVKQTGVVAIDQSKKQRTRRSASSFRIVIHGGENYGAIGPLRLSLTSKIGDVKRNVQTWMLRNRAAEFPNRPPQVFVELAGETLDDETVLCELDLKKDLSMRVEPPAEPPAPVPEASEAGEEQAS